MNGRFSSFYVFWIAVVDRDTRVSYLKVNTPSLDFNTPSRTTGNIIYADYIYINWKINIKYIYTINIYMYK